jgi:hypothetical protein
MLFLTCQVDCHWRPRDSGPPNQEPPESHPFLLSSSGGPSPVDQLPGIRTSFSSKEVSLPPSMGSLGTISFAPFSFHKCESQGLGKQIGLKK